MPRSATCAKLYPRLEQLEAQMRAVREELEGVVRASEPRTARGGRVKGDAPAAAQTRRPRSRTPTAGGRSSRGTTPTRSATGGRVRQFSRCKFDIEGQSQPRHGPAGYLAAQERVVALSAGDVLSRQDTIHTQHTSPARSAGAGSIRGWCSTVGPSEGITPAQDIVMIPVQSGAGVASSTPFGGRRSMGGWVRTGARANRTYREAMAAGTSSDLRTRSTLTRTYSLGDAHRVPRGRTPPPARPSHVRVPECRTYVTDDPSSLCASRAWYDRRLEDGDVNDGKRGGPVEVICYSPVGMSADAAPGRSSSRNKTWVESQAFHERQRQSLERGDDPPVLWGSSADGDRDPSPPGTPLSSAATMRSASVGTARRGRAHSRGRASSVGATTRTHSNPLPSSAPPRIKPNYLARRHLAAAVDENEDSYASPSRFYRHASQYA